MVLAHYRHHTSRFALANLVDHLTLVLQNTH